MSTRVSTAAVTAIAALLLYCGGSLVAAMLVSLAFIAPAVMFAGLAVVLMLAMIPGVQTRFSSRFSSFDVDTRNGR